jgi:hypothetical protein
VVPLVVVVPVVADPEVVAPVEVPVEAVQVVASRVPARVDLASQSWLSAGISQEGEELPGRFIERLVCR